MELKPHNSISRVFICWLLIVPYGIETTQQHKISFIQKTFNRTLWNWNKFVLLPPGFDLPLLIVPYGIETNGAIVRTSFITTFNRTLWNWNRIRCKSHQCRNSFNRTFWTWNFNDRLSMVYTHKSFNRTLWNWNISFSRTSFARFSLLIVPYGIETLLVYTVSTQSWYF